MMRTTGSCRRLAVIGAVALLAVLAAGEAAAQPDPDYSRGACSDYVLSSNEEDFMAAGGSGSFTVTWTWTPPETGSICLLFCSPGLCRAYGTPRTTASWITIDSWESDTVSYTVAENTSLQSREGTIRVGDATFTVRQEDFRCPLAPVDSATVNVGRGGGRHSVTGGTNSSCSFMVSADRDWIMVPSSISGNGTVNIDVKPNSGIARNGTVSIGSARIRIIQEAAACPSSPGSFSGIDEDHGGGTNHRTVPGRSDCSWSVSDNRSWISTSPSSVSGGDRLEIRVDPNSGGWRSGTVEVGGADISVSQSAAPCSASGSTASLSFGSGSGSQSATAGGLSACSFRVSDDRDWISVDSSSVSGGGSVNVSVTANDGSARSGTVTIGDARVEISQAGCPSSPGGAPEALDYGSGAESQSVQLTEDAGCTYAVSKDESWITVDPSNVAGAGTVTVSVTANDGSARSGTVTIGDARVQVSQASGCSASGSTASLSFGRRSGSKSATAGGSSACTFNVSDNRDWISVDSSSVSGGGSVSVSVTANDGRARSGRVTIGDASVRISQASGCSASGSTASLSFGSGSGIQSATAGGSSACRFRVSDDRDWISVSPSRVSGGGSVKVSVTANTGGARMGTVTIGTARVSVTQSAAACPASPGLTPTTVTFGADGSGDGAVAVGGSDHCDHAVAVSSGAQSWLSADVTAVDGGGTVTLRATTNTGVERTGTVTIGMSSVSVTQSAPACPASPGVTPPAVTFEADGSGAGGVTVSGLAACSHAVSVSSDAASWLRADVTEVDGGGTVTLSAAANTGGERLGTVTVGASVASVTQWAATCPAAPVVTPGLVSHPGAGGATPVAVRGSSSCQYAVGTDLTWITVDPVQVSGGGTVTVTVAEDADGAGARRGTATIGDSGVRVAQGNTTPVASADAVTAWRETETPVAVLDNDTDADDDPLSVASVATAPANGTAAVSADGQTVAYTSAAGWSGVETFTYSVTDGWGGTAEATVTVTVRSATPFTDALLTARVTPIKAVHLTEVRTRANAVRAGCGLAAATWTDPVLTAGVTPIKAAHLTEVRTAVTEAYTACQRTAPAWTDPVLTVGVTPIKAAHMLELRDAVIVLE